MFNIEFTNPHPAYTADAVQTLLSSQRIDAAHGTAFTGRPVTQLIADDENVIKLRTEYQLPLLEARRFIVQAREQEQRLGVHHPDKTWFLATNQHEDDERILIGNISPRLLPLHRTEQVLSVLSRDAFVTCIETLFTMSSRVVETFDLALDLCLSNFAIDSDKQVYYVDDDVYKGDNLNTIPHFLANLLRSQDWLDPRLLTHLGSAVRSRLLSDYNDTHCITIIAEDLRNLFIPAERKTWQSALIDALYGGERFSYQPKVTAPEIALLGDIHANAPALESALAYLDENGIEHVLVLGDIVGYGPHPQECVEMLRSREAFSIIRGNHDHAVATGKIISGTTSLANWTLNWTIDSIAEETRQWLAKLPAYLREGDWLAVHGAPKDKSFFNAYVYQMTYIENLNALEDKGVRLCFHGHTHIQKVYYRENGVDKSDETARQMLQGVQHALICPGSVGQPRNGIPGAELAVINLETLELKLHRLAYDMERTLRDMRKHHFPSSLIERLQCGH